MQKFFIYLNTIRYLKPVQIRYRIYYALRKKIRKITGYKVKEKAFNGKITKVKLYPGIINPVSYLGNYEFEFLNQKHGFKEKINWDFDGFGKLWTYNLNYFEFLHQEKLDKSEGLDLIYDFITNFDKNNIGKEPFPTSLRIINWIKFLVQNDIEDQKIIDNLYNQAYILYDNIEYHLMGNHLLENAFSLLYAGIYFDDSKLISKGEEILLIQLEEQILDDGAHFELSPMYHQLMFYRLLDVLNLVFNSKYQNQNILDLMIQKAGLMYSWLENITFLNGDIPLFNDSSPGIAPSTAELLNYAKRLNVVKKAKQLGESGFRKFKSGRFELIIDIGKIGPDYIPGHGHNDMFSFVLYIDNKPIIVDTGTTVYGGNSERRYLERSTASHNTVQVEDYEQAEIWDDFRIARRSYPKIVFEGKNKLIVEYIHFSKKYKHRRKFTIGENKIEIEDTINRVNFIFSYSGLGSPLGVRGKLWKKRKNEIQTISSNQKSVTFFHFDDKINSVLIGNRIDFEYGVIEFTKGDAQIDDYYLSKGFNKKAKSKKILVVFQEYLKTFVHIY